MNTGSPTPPVAAGRPRSRRGGGKRAPDPVPAGLRPTAKTPLVSAQMSRMPRTSTGPEVRFRRGLHAAGLRFRVHLRQLPGTPDIVLTRARMAVFIDGCFWHGCPTHGVLPKHNGAWWAEKLRGNKERDLRNDARLIDGGWLPVHVWEHDPAHPGPDLLNTGSRHRGSSSLLAVLERHLPALLRAGQPACDGSLRRTWMARTLGQVGRSTMQGIFRYEVESLQAVTLVEERRG